MLVLSRKNGQRITFTTAGGEHITLMIDQIHGKSARISIDAPQTVKILRSEAAAKLLRQGAALSTSQADSGTARQQGKD